MMNPILKCLPLLLALLLTLTACGTRDTVDETDADNTSATTTVGDNGVTDAPGDSGSEDTRSLKEIYDAYIAEVDAEFPSLVETPVNRDNFSYYFGITDSSVAESTFVSEPMMGAIPFGISMLRVKDGEDAAKIAAEMEAGIDPRRWVCVTASYVETAVNGNVILLVLDDDATRGAAIVEAFRAQ
ncbi:MAG: hypothetical protein IJX76_07340 [Clostridia bacterium]|nr:hypothetical protein [Clostridia bacterium]